AGPASISFSRPARRLDYPRRLLFQSALGVVATGVGGGCCRVQRLGLVAEPPTRMRLASAGRFAFAGLFGFGLVWFIAIPPLHDRPWQPQVAVMPRAIIDGDSVRFTGYRNFDYRTRDDFTERWEEREVSLSHLTSVDFFISYWSVGPVGHTFVSFNFDN